MAQKSPAPSLQPPHASHQVVVVLGPARSGKTYELVGRYHDVLAVNQSGPTASLDRVLWLAPSSRSAETVREQLIARGTVACLGPGVVTFDDLAKQILLAANSRTRPIQRGLQRDLLRRVVVAARDAKALKYFAEAAHRSGFADLLAEHIRELKRHDITPSAYKKISAQRGQPPQHQELARLYVDYEQLLAAHNLRDEEGAQWIARDAIASGACSRFQNLDLLVADGFTDFTRTQHEFIRLLAARSQQVFISLPEDPTPTRPDLFARTTATLAELQQYHPRLEVRRLAARPSACWPAMDYLADTIFRHPKPAPSAEALATLSQIEIVEAAGAQDEIVQIARRIKQRLADRLPVRERLLTGSSAELVSPSDIVVVFRSVTDVAPRVEEVFTRFGIPYAIETNRRLAQSPIYKTLVALLKLDQEDWPFRRVVSVLTNNMLAAIEAPARQAAEWLVRELQVASGRQPLLETITHLAAQLPSIDALSDHQQKRVTAAAIAIPALTHIATALDALPREATLTDWTTALENLATTLAIPPFTPSPTDPQQTGRLSDQSPQSPDTQAWRTLTTHLKTLDRLNTWLSAPPRTLSRDEFLTMLIDVATREPLPRSNDEVGRVRILSAPAARAVSARHLYLAGMSEQAFPASGGASHLASDAEYRFFSNAAHQQENVSAPSESPTASRPQGEMLLFYEVLSRAQETLTISYPALDSKAQELPPSPYVVEIKRMFAAAGSPIRCTAPQLLPVPESGTIGSLADWRVRAVAKAREANGDRRLLAGILSRAETQPLGHAIDAGIRTVHARARGDAFGPNEGVLAGPAIAARLAERFGPRHLWSPSQWETYAACPFKFFLQAVLKLDPLGDLVLETDFARRGSRLHHVLAAFHRHWPQQRGAQDLSDNDERALFASHLTQVIEDCIAASPAGGIDAALLELDRRQILKWANNHFDHHQKYHANCNSLEAAMSPAHLEFRFGSSRRDDGLADPDSTSKTFVLDIQGEPIRVTGQIDRIDVATVNGEKVFNVIDYKSGRRPSLKPQQIETGEQLQLPIYVEAAQLLLFDGQAKPLSAAYWSMGNGFDEKGALAKKKTKPKKDGDAGDQPALSWNDTYEMVHDLVRTFVDNIRHGDFPVASRDDKCTSYCNFSLACRIAQARASGKSLLPPAETNPQPAIQNPKS